MKKLNVWLILILFLAACTSNRRFLAGESVPYGAFGAVNNWTLAFRDEFDGTTLDLDKWRPNWLGGSDTTITPPINSLELSCYAPENVLVSDGVLILTAKTSTLGTACKTQSGTAAYSSGLIHSNDHFNTAYGYFEARIWNPASPNHAGVWPAFWINGQSWPTNEVIDIMECYGTDASCSYHYHYSGGGSGGNSMIIGSTTGYHIYAAYWEPGKITWFYDGVQVWQYTTGIMSASHYIILNLGVIGDQITIPSQMLVDYVRVWKITGGLTNTPTSAITTLTRTTTPVISTLMAQHLITLSASIVRNFYVAPTGNDSNPGTITAPFKTIQKAVDVVQAGNTVYVRGGTYNERVFINKIGTADAPIIISSYPDELAIIDGNNSLPSGGDRYTPLVYIRGSYVKFQNFEVRNSTGRGVQLMGSNNSAIGNNVHHSWDIGIYIAGSYITLENNRVWRSAESNYVHYSNEDWPGGIAWGAAGSPNLAPFAVIRNNVVYQTSGEGIICMYTDNALVEGNTVYDNWAMNIYLDQCSYTTIQKNTVYYTTDEQYWRNTDSPKGGIIIANENIQAYPIGHDRIIINNVLINNGTNVGFWKGFAPNAALVNDVIANNTLVNAYKAGIGIDFGPHQNTRIFDNLVFQPVGSAANVSGGGITFFYNLWYPLNGITGIGDIRADPQFINASAGDFRLQVTSPACTGGENGSYMGALPCGIQPPTMTIAPTNSDPIRTPTQLGP